MFARRSEHAARGGDVRHRILDRHELLAGRGLDPFGARDDGQDQRVAPMHQMPAVELGRDADGEVELAYRVIGAIGIGDRTDKIAAEADENFRRAREHRLDRFDRMMAMIARRFETEHVADAIEIGPARFLVDANGAVALDVRMAADRGDARAGLAVVALEEQQIGDLLDERSEEHTSELQSLMRISYAVFCLKKKKK